MVKLIADSGATKCEWCLLINGKAKKIFTQGISPYFLNKEQIVSLVEKELFPKLKNASPEEIYFYGTGLSNPLNARIIKAALKAVFSNAIIEVNTDLLGAA